MHPLSTFPYLLSYGLIAPTLLRLVASFFVADFGVKRYKKTNHWLFVIYIISAILLFLGLYTQIASIVAILILKWDFYMERKTMMLTPDQKKIYFLVIFILLSLLFTGPGFFAFDLPL